MVNHLENVQKRLKVKIMIKKFLRFIIIIVVIGALGYGGFLVFVNPAGFTDKEELINSYFENITSESLCEDHFNTETEDFCINFQTLIEDKTIVVTSLISNGSGYRVQALIDDEETEFDFTFEEIEVTGLKAFMNSKYFKIDLIT